MTRGDILAERRKSSLEVKGWNVFFSSFFPLRGTGSGGGSLTALFFCMKTEQLLPRLLFHMKVGWGWGYAICTNAINAV